MLGFMTAALYAAERGPLPFLTGGDISMLLRQEEAGVVFKDADGPKDLIALMTDAGCNCFRVRLFVNPTGRGGVVQDVSYALEMAKRIKAARGIFLLDFHYSDTWADPAHQTKPAAWKDMPFDELVQTVQTYTADVIARFKAHHLLPDIVQLGNEIQPGFLWPDGRLDGPDPEDSWGRFARLLNAAVGGLRAAAPGDDIKIMIHIACGGDFGKTDWFFSNLQKYDVPYDLIGQSYYPWWHGTLKELEDTLTRTAEKFKKDIIIVETAYPNSAVERFEPGADPNDAMPWPMSPEGQREFLAALVRTVRRTPDNRGRGVVWWYPESVPANTRGGWYNGKMALFDPNGLALPAMQSLAAPKAAIY
jgi:arabinogalactan endo-1,4-beta-galactosidase